MHWFQHVSFEGLGLIEEWAHANSHELDCTRLDNHDQLPQVDSYDLLIVMGGPMGIYDEKEYPWLLAEKAHIQEAIAKKKSVLGICLGSQLLAEALGGSVSSNKVKEIGWYTIARKKILPDNLEKILPSQQRVLHWHGDTFSLPPGAVALYSSEACANQAFIYDNRILALQFHLEIGYREIQPMIHHCHHELVEEQWVQDKSLLLKMAEADLGCQKMLFDLLDYLVICSTEEVSYENTL